MLKRLATFLVIFCFLFEQCGFAQVAAQAPVPSHLTGLLTPDRFHPVQLRSLSYNPSSRTFDVMVDKGDQVSLSVSQQRIAAQQLFSYFQIGLRLPNSMFWVNLRPDAPTKIIDPYLERTEMGKILLAADLQLKRDIAGLTAPNTAAGKKYWDKLYSKAEGLFGNGEDYEIPTVIRPWIVPGEIIIKNTPSGVFVYKAALSVMLEQDYLKNAPRFETNDARVRELNAYSSSLIKELILPELIRQVNSAKRYAQLRQVYYSLILAQWYKARAGMIADASAPARKGIDSKDLTGLTAGSPWSKEQYFNAYKKSFERGEYSLEDSVRGRSGITIRRYCSGGVSTGNIVAAPGSAVIGGSDLSRELSNLEGIGVSSFMQDTGEITDGGNREVSQNGGASDISGILSKADAVEDAALIANLKAGVITDPVQLRMVGMLLELKQNHLFSQWDAPGVNDVKKRDFLMQVAKTDEGYSTGLSGYQENARKLLLDSKNGVNPFEGYTPEVPEGVQLDKLDDEFRGYENAGLLAANKAAFVMVAGGMGERLGYDGIKVGIPHDLATMRTYLERYCRSILALQAKSNYLNDEHHRIPFVIMTSDDTNDLTVKLLEENGNFGMEKGQIVILKQGAVPTMINNNGDFVLEKGDHYRLETKPSGHGDVHMLIAQAGLVDEWLNDGITHTVFIQDTNGQVFNGVLAGLGVSLDKDFDFNFLTVPRSAGEKAGAITKLKRADGSFIIGNVEYNQLEPLMKAAGQPGDVADPATGMSPYPGNLNVYIVKNTSYKSILDQTDGIIEEFINPKYSDSDPTKNTFKSSTRSERMMQDLAKKMADIDATVGFTNFDKRVVFSPSKNNLATGAANPASGNYPDTMSTSENDYYSYNRRLLKLAGVEIDAEGHERKSQGVPYTEGARVVLEKNFAATADEVMARVNGGRVSDRSVLVLDGDIIVDNLDLDGTLIVQAGPGVKLQIKNAKVRNDGWEFIDLTQKEMQTEVQEFSAPASLRVRGYTVNKKGERIVNITEPGNYVMDASGQVSKVITQVYIPATTSQNLQNADFANTEEPTFKKYSALVQNGVTPAQNNPVKGEILGAREFDLAAETVDLRDESVAREKYDELGKTVKVSAAMSAGGLSSRGGGIFTAKFAFDSDLPVIGGKTFIDLKMEQALKGGAQDYVIMTSFIRLDAVAEALGIDYVSLKNDVIAKGFAKRKVRGMDVYIYCQGLQVRINPDNEALEEYYYKAVVKKQAELKNRPEELAKYKAALRKGIDSQKDMAGQMVVARNGEPVVNPPGHWDFVRDLALSGVLGVMDAKKVDMVFHSNLNNPVASIPDYIKGAFQSKIMEARKAGQPEPVAMFLLGDNRGEKGGLLAKVRYSDGREVVQLVEGIGLTPEALAKINQADKDGKLTEVFPYFNTATFLLNVRGLMKLFNLEENYQTNLTRDEILKRVDDVTARVPVYMDLKEEQDGDRILVGYQLERIYGDLTSIAPWVPAAVDRDVHFVPVKEEKDIKDAEKMAQTAAIINGRAFTAGAVTTRLLEPVKKAIAFGTSGWRGKWMLDDGQELDFTIGNIRRVVQGIASYYKDSIKTGVVLIGYDPRGENKSWAQEAAQILAANGVPVRIVAAGPTPTPVLAMMANADEKISGVINLTASHNSMEDDGIKFSPYHGGAADKQATDSIAKLSNNARVYHTMDFETARENGLITVVSEDEAVNIYAYKFLIPELKRFGAWDAITEYIKNKPEFSIILDPMQGTGVKYLNAIFSELSREVGRKFYRMIHTNNLDNSFQEVGNAPNPTEEKNVADLISLVKADASGNTFGVAVDGDADRFRHIDFGGADISANEFAAIALFFLAMNHGLTGAVGKTVATSNYINEVAKYLESQGKDVSLIETAVGFKWFVEMATREKEPVDFLVAVEESAHAGFKPFLMKSWDDGIANAMIGLWILAETGKSLSEYKKFVDDTIGKQFTYDRKSVKVTPEAKAKVQELINITKKELENNVAFGQMTISQVIKEFGIDQKVADVITLDGVKVVFESGDWFLIRLSGTEPVARLYTEVTDVARQEVLIDYGRNVLGDASAKKDGGTGKYGGIDFTALPLLVQPSVRPAALPAVPVSLAELDSQWQDIVKQLNAGSVPCDSLREYVVGCRSQKLASVHLKRAHVYVDSLLRMEQDAAVRTSAQMKEVIADLAG